MKHLLLSLLILSLSACATMKPEEKRAFWQQKINETKPGNALVIGRMETTSTNLLTQDAMPAQCAYVSLEPRESGIGAASNSFSEMYYLNDTPTNKPRLFVIRATPGYYNVVFHCNTKDVAPTGYNIIVKRDDTFLYVGDFKSKISDAFFGNSDNLGANLLMAGLGGQTAEMELHTDTQVMNNAEETFDQFTADTGISSPPLAHSIAVPNR
ncbi:MAG: hypothetical protein EB060_06835 [Proteobacteria bacterium]|nr:hypothetical protein [Pseudomonadota bacterium]